MSEAAAHESVHEAIDALGAKADELGSLGVIKPISQLLNWPEWLRANTDIGGVGELPPRVTWRNKILIYQNILDNADLAFVLRRAIHAPDLLVQPGYQMAFRSAPNLREALQLFANAVTQVNPHLDVRTNSIGGLITFSVHPTVPLGRIGDFAGFLGVLIMYGAVTAQLTRDLDRVKLGFAGEEEVYGVARDAILCDLATRQTGNFLQMSLELADCPNPNSDVALWQLARNRIQTQLQLDRDQVLTSKIRKYILRGILEHKTVPTVDSIARQEGLSPRSLHYQLAECGVAFRDLVDEERRRLALELISKPDLQMREIAARLGFADSATFSRAFRKWFGTSPSAFRNS